MLFNDVPDFRDGNQQIKKREAPEAWTKNLNKLRQKDRDARWTKKSKMNFYGYKNHIKVDYGTKLIGTYAVSDAGQKLYAESAYIGQDESIEWCGMQAEVHEKGSSTCKPTDKQKASNHNKSKARARVEHVFGYMTNSMNGMFIKTIGILRAAAKIGLSNQTYNMMRCTQINKKVYNVFLG